MNLRNFVRRSAIASLFIAAAFAPLNAQDGNPAPGPDRPGPDVETPAPVPAEQSQIEVVFVLDTTGSMSGLIQSAKDKIWAIASQLATADPAPSIKMGLVAYRDRGDEYVTKQFDLSDDLDAMYRELMNFQAGGGGDTPESVNQGLNEAVEKLSWSDNADTYKVIFLVGDCPPHMDYQDDVKYQASCEAAVKKNIVINTIQCGADGSTTPIWKEIARLGEGSMFQVDQSGGAKVIATPFDGDLAEASRKLDATRVWYGSAEEQKAQAERDARADDIYESAPAGAQAQRAEYNRSAAGAANWVGHAKELLTDLAAGTIKLEDVKDEELPENMREMSAEERVAYVEKVKAERAALQAQVDELAKKRQAFIAEERRKQAGDKPTWESAVFNSMREQAARLGMIFKASELDTGSDEPDDSDSDDGSDSEDGEE